MNSSEVNKHGVITVMWNGVGLYSFYSIAAMWYFCRTPSTRYRYLRVVNGDVWKPYSCRSCFHIESKNSSKTCWGPHQIIVFPLLQHVLNCTFLHSIGLGLKLSFTNFFPKPMLCNIPVSRQLQLYSLLCKSILLQCLNLFTHIYLLSCTRFKQKNVSMVLQSRY
jgi:hypothetical protein